MKCLVLGGRGFLGKHLVRALLRQGSQVCVFDRPDPTAEVELAEQGAEFIGGDFLDRDDLLRAIDGCTVVFHLLATTLPKSSNDSPFDDASTNILGTIAFLDIVAQMHNVRVIFASSGGTVYGIPHTLPISESHPTDPICAYGVSKLAIEKYLALYGRLRGVDHGILRMANVYGEGQSPFRAQGAIAVFCYKALRNEVIEIWGDGEVVRDYVHVDDVVGAMVAAITYVGGERKFNIGAGQGHSLKEVLATLEAALGRRVVVRYTQSRQFDVPANVLDIRLARTELHWEPRVSLQAGVARVFDWIARTYP